ncbi:MULTISPECIES: cytochrome P450 [Henriciella]|uniref:cytochrome P450 n=2 Tax=Hyphomonadaceae TaxID=69657 RepID=UPI0035195378
MRLFDLTSQDYLRAPHEQLLAAMEEGPWAQTKLPFIGRLKLLLGHAECQALLKDQDKFAVDARNAGHKSAFGLRFLPRSLKIMASNLLTMDDPDHRRLRGLVDEPFHRVAIDVQRPVIRETCEEIVETMLRTGARDLVTGLCRELPQRVIFDLLGFSRDARTRLQNVMAGIAGSTSAFAMIRAVMKLKPAQAAMREEFERVRAEPRPGLVSELVHAGEDGEKMSDDELLAMVFVLFAAGQETTSHFISSAVWTLLTQPGKADEYRAGDEDARGVAVDELMRYCTPVQMTKPRHPRAPLMLHGQALQRGERVLALLASANVDPRVFDNPAELDLKRRPNRHLGWGGGPHICLGLHLARAEAQAAFDCLFDRFPGLAIDGDPNALKWIPRAGIRGLKSLPLRFQ